jgi:Trk-type K+ transport system membrane component
MKSKIGGLIFRTGLGFNLVTRLTHARFCAFCAFPMNKLKKFVAHPTTRALGAMLVTASCVLFGFLLIVAILSHFSR